MGRALGEKGLQEPCGDPSFGHAGRWVCWGRGQAGRARTAQEDVGTRGSHRVLLKAGIPGKPIPGLPGRQQHLPPRNPVALSPPTSWRLLWARTEKEPAAPSTVCSQTTLRGVPALASDTPPRALASLNIPRPQHSWHSALVPALKSAASGAQPVFRCEVARLSRDSPVLCLLGEGWGV